MLVYVKMSNISSDVFLSCISNETVDGYYFSTDYLELAPPFQ